MGCVRRRQHTCLPVAALAGALMLLAGCGGSSSPHSGTTSTRSSTANAGATTATATASGTTMVVSASASGVTATMRGSSHTPTVGPWPVHFTVTRDGRPAQASLGYEFLFGGQVVAHRSHYVFTGSFADIVRWPASAVGYPLTLRAVITSGTTVINLDYPIHVSR